MRGRGLIKSGHLLVLWIAALNPFASCGDAAKEAFPDAFGPPAPVEYEAAELPRITVDRVELTQMLLTGRYVELEDALVAVLAEAREDLDMETNALVAMLTFSTTREDVGEALESWVERVPDSAIARVAYAEHLFSRAWAERGSDTASETSRDQFAGMTRYFELALPQLARARELDPDSLEAILVQNGIARARNDEHWIVDLEREARRISPASYRARSAFLINRLPRWGGGTHAASERYAEVSQEHAGENPRLRLLLGYPHWDRGRYAAGAGQPAKAIQHFQTALVEGGEAARFLESRARARFDLDDIEGSKQDFERALALRPQTVEYLAMLSKRRSDVGELDTAFRELESARAINPKHSELKHAAYYVARRAGQEAGRQLKQKTPESFARAEELIGLEQHWSPDDPWTVYDRGRLEAHRPDLNAAEAIYEECIAAHPGFFECYRQLDWLLAKRRDWDGIVAYWDRFLEIEPDHAKAHLERAGTHRRRKDMKSAYADLESACSLGSQEACKILKRPRAGAG